VDYVLLLSIPAEQTGRGGLNKKTYKLSVSCPEYFVFYREVFVSEFDFGQLLFGVREGNVDDATFFILGKQAGVQDEQRDKC